MANFVPPEATQHAPPGGRSWCFAIARAHVGCLLPES